MLPHRRMLAVGLACDIAHSVGDLLQGDISALAVERKIIRFIPAKHRPVVPAVARKILAVEGRGAVAQLDLQRLAGRIEKIGIKMQHIQLELVVSDLAVCQIGEDGGLAVIRGAFGGLFPAAVIPGSSAAAARFGRLRLARIGGRGWLCRLRRLGRLRLCRRLGFRRLGRFCRFGFLRFRGVLDRLRSLSLRPNGCRL